MNLPIHQPPMQKPPELDKATEKELDDAVNDPIFWEVTTDESDVSLERSLIEMENKMLLERRAPTPPIEDLVCPEVKAHYKQDGDGVQVWTGLCSPPASPTHPRKRRRAHDDSQPSKIEPLKLLKDKLIIWGSTVVNQFFGTRIGFLVEKEYFTDINYSASQLVKEVQKFLAVSFEMGDPKPLEQVNQIFKEAGYCCGRSCYYPSRTVKCSASTSEKECMVPMKEKYIEVRGPQGVKNYCQNHFKKVKPLLRSDGSKKVERTTGIVNLEECDKCGRYYHLSCRAAGLLKDRDCKCGEPSQQLMSPKELPETSESSSMECRFNVLLESQFEELLKHESNGLLKSQLDELRRNITIRIFVSDVLYERLEKGEDEHRDVGRSRETISSFVENGAIDLPYRCKLILAFGKLPGVSSYVTFFSMMTREYDENCPKAGEISLEYLDSIKFYKTEVRSMIYHAILNSYFDCAKDRGFSVVKFWAFPPPVNEEYLFFGHPEDQPTPTQLNLVQFYENMIKSNAGIYSVEKGLFISPQTTDIGVVIDAFQSNSLIYQIVANGISKYKKKSDKETAIASPQNPEKLKQYLQKAAEPNKKVLFNLILRDNSVEGAGKPPRIEVANILQMAESRYDFRHVQLLEGMDFGNLGANIVSTSKLTEVILRDIKQPIE